MEAQRCGRGRCVCRWGGSTVLRKRVRVVGSGDGVHGAGGGAIAAALLLAHGLLSCREVCARCTRRGSCPYSGRVILGARCSHSAAIARRAGVRARGAVLLSMCTLLLHRLRIPFRADARTQLSRPRTTPCVRPTHRARSLVIVRPLNFAFLAYSHTCSTTASSSRRRRCWERAEQRSRR